MACSFVADRAGFEAAQRQPVQFRGNWATVLESDHLAVVASGFKWTEGPLWVASEQALYFTDTIDAKIFRIGSDGDCKVHVTEGGGSDGTNCPDIDTLAEPGSNGMAEDPSDPGVVVICQHPTHRVVRTRLNDAAPGTPFHKLAFEVVADRHDGKPFNSPNDVVVAQDGAIWFTDPIYGMLRKDNFCDAWAPEGSYLNKRMADERVGCCGVYRVAPRAGPTGAVSLATRLHYRPNGLAFSPDGSKLYIADSVIGCTAITEYPVDRTTQALGKASFVFTPATLGCELGFNPNRARMGNEGLADGFKVDADGRIWTSMPDGLCVFDPVTRTVVCEVIFGTNTSNVCFGKGGDVWITGLGHLWRLTRKL